MLCPKIVDVHLVKYGRGVGTPLLDLYFNPDTLGSHCPKWMLGSLILCESMQFQLNKAYKKSSIKKQSKCGKHIYWPDRIIGNLAQSNVE